MVVLVLLHVDKRALELEVELLSIIVLVHSCHHLTHLVVDADERVLLGVKVLNNDLRFPVSLAVDRDEVLKGVKLGHNQVITHDRLIQHVFPLSVG